MQDNSTKTLVMANGNPVIHPAPDMPKLLAQASSLLPLAIAYAFCLSSIYTLIFFIIIGIDPLYVPLNISDYIVTFSQWTFSIIYFFIIISVSFLTIHVCKNEKMKERIKIRFSILLSIIFGISIYLFKVYTNYKISITFIIIGIFLFFIITTNWFNNKPDMEKLLPISVFILFSIEICILFSSQIYFQLDDANKNSQTFTTSKIFIAGVLLRSFDKGILVYQYPNKIKNGDGKARIFFLPYDKGHILEFPTDLALPMPKTPPLPVPSGPPSTCLE